MRRSLVDGKVALVTRARREIGREIALTLAREGAAVGGSHPPDAQQTALAAMVVQEARQVGAKAIALGADMTDGPAVREARWQPWQTPSAASTSSSPMPGSRIAVRWST